jgi:glycosyltransferase involved in cell wall biosynthesis
MKIAILTHIKHPVAQPFAGGLEAFTYEAVRRLKSRGHDVTLFARTGSDPSLPFKEVNVASSTDFVMDRHSHDMLSAEYIAEHHAYMDCMQSIDGQGFDVIFNNSLHYVPITMAALVTTPMLTVLHTPPFFELANAVTASQLRGTHCYVTVSKSNAESWAALIPNCRIIPNGIALDAWTPERNKTKSYAIWYGRLVPEKGAHHALDAARSIGMPIRIAGFVSNQSYFDREIAPRLGQGATYLGHLDQSTMAATISQASVSVVTPCWDEPFGMVLAESLACGTPVAAFNRGAIRELASPDTVALASTPDAAALAQAMRAAVRLSPVACRQRAEALWDIEAMIDRYEDLLESVCMGAPVMDALVNGASAIGAGVNA